MQNIPADETVDYLTFFQLIDPWQSDNLNGTAQ